MSIPRVLTEPRLSLPAAAIRFGVSFPTVRRWVAAGIKGVKLETAKVGGARVTSPDACDRFLEALNPETEKPTRTAAQRRRAAVASGNRLAAMGL
ncbi:MAG TPA: DUF1580 domain-containing protein [Urbifossiella sp.]|nr:DUF1580 domain-containing protein [Urbifossiella sp.]